MDAVQRRVSLDSPENLAFGRPVSLLELLERIAALLGVSPRAEFVAPRVGDVRNPENDPAPLESTSPGVTPVELHPALERTVAWLERRLGGST